MAAATVRAARNEKESASGRERRQSRCRSSRVIGAAAEDALMRSRSPAVATARSGTRTGNGTATANVTGTRTRSAAIQNAVATKDATRITARATIATIVPKTATATESGSGIVTGRGSEIATRIGTVGVRRRAVATTVARNAIIIITTTHRQPPLQRSVQHQSVDPMMNAVVVAGTLDPVPAHQRARRPLVAAISRNSHANIANATPAAAPDLRRKNKPQHFAVELWPDLICCSLNQAAEQDQRQLMQQQRRGLQRPLW